MKARRRSHSLAGRSANSSEEAGPYGVLRAHVSGREKVRPGSSTTAVGARSKIMTAAR
jgi:hypothetical protein